MLHGTIFALAQTLQPTERPNAGSRTWARPGVSAERVNLCMALVALAVAQAFERRNEYCGWTSEEFERKRIEMLMLSHSLVTQ